MKNIDNLYSETFKIRASEIDLNGKLNLPSLCMLLQEVAGNHALTMQFDITDLQEDNLTWVLHRLDIQIDHYPRWRDTITIKTWPAAGDALRAYRNYLMYDEEGTEFGRCLSYWMIINLDSRRPVRIPQRILDLRLADMDHVKDINNSRLPVPNFDKRSQVIKVRKTDLDMNNHVNNAKYVTWMLEDLSDEKMSSISNIDIMFLQEALVGEKLSTFSQIQTNSSNHMITKNMNKSLAVAEIKYRD